MNAQESKAVETRLKAYRHLEIRQNQLRAAIDAITEDKGHPNETGPFTGNMRESRRINHMSFWFSETCGKSPPVQMTINDLGIEAYEFQRDLLTLLRAKKSEIEKEMERL
jgi:hypothetical protein